MVNSTKTTDASINALLASAATASFISYDDGFLSILGPNLTFELIEERDLEFVFEAAVWVPERNEVFFPSSVLDQAKDGAGHFEVLNLKTKRFPTSSTLRPSIVLMVETITTASSTSPRLVP